MYFADITKKATGRSFSFSPENPTGVKSGGSKGSPIEKLNPCTFVQPGETLVLADTDGPAVIEHIWVTGAMNCHMILRIYWDNCEVPAVEAPLPAFFGHAYRENVRDVYGNYPILNSALLLDAPCRGFNSYFRMPFRKHCKITVENRDKREAFNIYYEVSGRFEEVSEDTLYFYASYRQEQPHKAGTPYTIIDGIEGPGNFLGVTMSVGLNGKNGCWVEGEVKMYIDDDKYPSINYTGTEDYFCGAYAFGYDMIGKYQSYSGLFVGMHAIMGGNIADRSVGSYDVQPRFMGYRFHVPDPIGFEKNFKMEILNMGYERDNAYGRRDDFASVAYWYQNLTDKPLAPLPGDMEVNLV